MGSGNILKLINIVSMFNEWLWKYEYFTNLINMACITNILAKRSHLW